MAMRAAGLVVLGLLICILALLAGGAWIFYTPSGLQWLTARAVGFSGERLESRGMSGTLAAGARAVARAVAKTGARGFALQGASKPPRKIASRQPPRSAQREWLKVGAHGA